MMMNTVIVDSSFSDLTSASNEANNINGNGIDAKPAKKKNKNPSNPELDPEGEIIALSPRTLLTTNRFVCEVCQKGFKREQNLQLHRRGHNLPWKLKQRTNKEIKKKYYYICPEPTCVHHDPSRPLGDLTGVKKHYSRKHGEKKWKCEKCSKCYAVQSDCKAHSRLCGTREYKCDCGTSFNRKDSFITHRAFCDALVQHRSNPFLPSQSTSHFNFHNHGVQEIFQHKGEEDELQQSFNHPRLEIQPWLTCPTPTNNNNLSSQLFTSNPTDQASPHMSATGLLQKVAEMGVKMSSSSCSSTPCFTRPHQAHNHHTSGETNIFINSFTCSGGSSLVLPSREVIPTGFVHHGFDQTVDAAGNSSLFSNTLMMSSSLQNNNNVFDQYSMFEDNFDHQMMMMMMNGKNHDNIITTQSAGVYVSGNGVGGGSGSGGGGGGGSGGGLTRDFLGLRAFPNGYGWT